MTALATTQTTALTPPRKPGRPRKQVAAPAAWERVPARENIPHYLAGTGPASFKAGLPAHERAVVDAGLAILARYLGQPGAIFDGPQAVRDYLLMQFANERRELFGVLWLDSQHRVICFEVASVGTATQASVYPRELAHAALIHNATACILTHNHPSGNLQPSNTDKALTRTLKTTLALLDVRVLDHFIVGGGCTTSMAELGLV